MTEGSIRSEAGERVRGFSGAHLLVIGASVALAACGSPAEHQPEPGEVERFTDRIDRNAADAKAVAVAEADERAENRADSAVRRIADSEKKRLEAQ